MPPRLRVVSSNRFPPPEKLGRQFDAQRLTDLREARMNIHAIGEPSDRTPVANPTRLDTQLTGRLRRAAQLLNDAVYGHDPQRYSSGLKKSSGLIHEKTLATGHAKIAGMAKPSKHQRIPVNPESLDAIGARLFLLRTHLGLNQTQLCKRAGIATNTYNQWENAKSRPELDKALTFCRNLRVSLDWLYRGDDSGLRHDLAQALIELTETAAQ